MNTRKFKMLCDGQFVGFIFITDNNPKFPGHKLATIWPFERQGSWTEGDIELTGRKHIIDVFSLDKTDEEIQTDLINRTEVRDKCGNFTVELNE